ncbi:Plasmid recombination enzyme [Vibrio crassostreae]|nr:Plasmid recombination enzyme [Vibrio crassostreae]
MYQFLHFETYARKASKTKKAFETIVKEFMREHGNCPHVKNPQTPKLLYGVDAYAANEIICNIASSSKDKKGRKIRTDAQVCVSGVMSFPRELRNEDESFYQSWLIDNIKYLKEKYGNNLLSILEHDDEEHPHIHYVVTNRNVEKNGDFNVANIHKPINAREREKGRKAKYDAYKQACRLEQDEYYNAVSIKYGLLRIGPGRQRLSRAAYKAAKHNAMMLAKSIKQNEQKSNELTRKLQGVELKKDKLAILEKSVKDNAKYVIQQKDDLKKRETSLNEKEASVNAQENLLLTFLDKNPEPNKAKDFYSKMVNSLKLKLDEYMDLFKEYRSKYNKLTVCHKKLEDSHDKTKIENKKLKSENLKLKAALQIYKDSANMIESTMSYHP